ncbi:DUF3685 domain-containing protein [Cucumis melo var. makuwa]|uniref:DUF3685 domain-containing protein n=1 Tax=Cucumis melo var. makuwa TaxID=1194695 RepID=A0A5A7TJG3_CUCMM|nr:DUF3685 domain-containing protein [Cucumis melo var. makuwa]TYK18059.1 DUF3685 domain-containing protein [Cucumis melo var. makuwa]
MNFLQMAEHVAVTPSPCIKLQIWRAPFKVKSLALGNLSFKREPRKSSSESYKFIRISTWRRHELIGSCGSNFIVNPAPRKTFREHAYLRSLVNVDGTTASEAIFVDQFLLMTSIFLTYMAGVIPVPKSNQHGNINSQTNSVLDNQTFSGSGMKTDGQINPKHALVVVKGKILDFLDAFERRKSMETEVLEFTECQAKRPLCLNAIGEGPRLRLLWASFQLIEEEVNNISVATIQNMDDLSKIFSEFILKSSRPVCMSWLRNELSMENNDSSKAFLSLMSENFKAEDNILPGIKKSGKEELFAELMHFLSFGARSSIAIERLRQQIAAIETTIGMTPNTVPMYSENSVTSFPTSSSYVNSSPTTLESIIQSGIPQPFSLISIHGKNPWILDSGATDHLTGSSEHFVSYIPCAGNEKIRIADGPELGEDDWHCPTQ